jgi:hypothetical protein
MLSDPPNMSQGLSPGDAAHVSPYVELMLKLCCSVYCPVAGFMVWRVERLWNSWNWLRADRFTVIMETGQTLEQLELAES